MVSTWFLICWVFAYWSILKKMHWECRNHLSFSHSWPALSLCQALQVLTWLSLQMEPCPLGAHYQPCWSPCKDACWLPHCLTNLHARWDQQPDLLPCTSCQGQAWSEPLILWIQGWTLPWAGILDTGVLLLCLSSSAPASICVHNKAERLTTVSATISHSGSPARACRHLQKHVSHGSVPQERQKGNWAW